MASSLSNLANKFQKFLKFIELNVNTDMMIKILRLVELNISVATNFLNTETLKRRLP